MKVWKQFRAMASDEELVQRDLTPIAGVDFDLYVEVVASLGEATLDPTEAPSPAARRGVSAVDWQIASSAWNDRLRLNPEVARRFDARTIRAAA